MKAYIGSALFLLCLMCNASLLIAQDLPADSEKKITENDIVLADGESTLALRDSGTIKKSETSTVSLLLQLVLSLAGVCALIYGVLYFIKRTRRFPVDSDPFLTQLASLSLAPDKSVYIVGLINKAYLLGVSSSTISLIAEITDKELIDAMNLHAAQAPSPKKDFSSLLYTFFPAAKQSKAHPLDSFLAEQRTRLKKTRYSDTSADTSPTEVPYDVEGREREPSA
ncbi:MAG: FliO/MopB family protein [Treponema sp.]